MIHLSKGASKNAIEIPIPKEEQKFKEDIRGSEKIIFKKDNVHNRFENFYRSQRETECIKYFMEMTYTEIRACALKMSPEKKFG